MSRPAWPLLSPMTDPDGTFAKEALEAGFRVGDFLVEPMLQRVTGNGETSPLEPRVMEVLVRLAEQPGRPVSKDEFLDELWEGVVVTDDALMRCIGELRRTLGDDAQAPRYIETIRKRGYRLVAPVTLVPGTRAPGSRAPEGTGPAPAGAPAIEPPVGRATPPRRWWAALAGGALALVGLGALLVWLWPTPEAAVPTPLRAVPLTSYPGVERDPALSPDGTVLAFVWTDGDGGGTDLYVQQVGVMSPLRLTDTLDSEASPAWSPDGQRIAFVRGGAVYSVPAIGGAERRLTDLGGRAVREVAWSPDGATLALSAETEPGGPLGLWLLPLASLQPRALTTPPPDIRGDLSPAFSPDGRQLAFARSTTERVDDLYVIDSAGGEARRVTTDHADLSGLDWTRDGARLVFASDRGGESAQWSVDAEGGEPTWVHTTGEGTGASQPTLARQSGRLAFVQRAEDTNLWLQPLDSVAAAPEKALVASTRWDSHPALSDDGQRLAFVSNRSGAYEVWVAGADGAGAYPVTALGGPFVMTPRWSPDGRRIAFVAKVEGSADVYVIDAAGGQPRRVTTAASNDLAPAWSRDGRTLYFASTRTGRWEVWARPADGSGAPVQITDGGGFAAQESPDGQALYTTRPGAAGLWRQPVAGGRAVRVLSPLGPADWGNWAVTTSGVYYVRRDAEVALYRWDPTTGRDARVVRIPQLPEHPALALSADGRHAVVARLDWSDSDIMLVEAFD